MLCLKNAHWETLGPRWFEGVDEVICQRCGKRWRWLSDCGQVEIEEMKLLVTGGRDYADRDFVFKVLDALHKDRPIALLVHGVTRRADSLACEWSKERGVPVDAHPADWKRWGRSAGPRRSREMLTLGVIWSSPSLAASARPTWSVRRRTRVLRLWT